MGRRAGRPRTQELAKDARVGRDVHGGFPSSASSLMPRALGEAQNQRVMDSCLIRKTSPQAHWGDLEVLSSPRNSTLAAHGASHRTEDSRGHTGRCEEGSRLSGSDLLIRPLAAETLEMHQSHQP